MGKLLVMIMFMAKVKFKEFQSKEVDVGTTMDQVKVANQKEINKICLLDVSQ